MLELRESTWNTPPPEHTSRARRNPTLLYTWWCTCFAAAVIITRLIGRKVRSNMLFREDWVMLASMIPLFIRLGLIHVVLLYGTNNVALDGHTFTDQEIRHRETGSQFVLAARIFYAAFIWTSKLAVSEFLKRITIRIWRRKYERILHSIRIFLVVTFIAVVVATLVECRPFPHYWQVIPDPGPQCRTGYAHLLTMGVADIVTDVLLVVFPIPIVLKTGRTWKRKISTILLFSTSIALIIVTALRMPEVIKHHGKQQYRTTWASSEILASAFVSNAVIIGSFLRDKGTKKNRFKSYSATDSIDKVSTRRPTIGTLLQNSSDESLFRSFNGRIPHHLLENGEVVLKPAPVALPAVSSHLSDDNNRGMDPSVEAYEHVLSAEGNGEMEGVDPSDPSKKPMGFFDIGGLLDSNPTPPMRSRATTFGSSSQSGSAIVDFAVPETHSQSRRGSKHRISDHVCDLPQIKARIESSRGNDKPEADGAHSPTSGRRSSLTPHSNLQPMLEGQEFEAGSQEPPPLTRQRSFTEPSRPDFNASIPDSQRRWAQPLLPRASTTSTVGSRPPLSRPGTQQSLQDIGGLLMPDHQPDASASALYRFRTAPIGKDAQDRNGIVNNPAREDQELDFVDAGGLLS